MNITKQQIDSLNAVLNITVEPADYQENVNKQLRENAKKVSMPGFRAGKVPFGMVKKMYGKSVMADEINKILNDSLYKFLDENRIEFLGNPLPVDTDRELNFDIDNPSTLVFDYELGLAPDFDAKVDGSKSFEYLTVKVDDETVNKEVESLALRYGKFEKAEVVEDGDLLSGEFKQLAADGTVLENGIAVNKSISLRTVEDADLKAQLIGLKKGEMVTVDVKKVWNDAASIARNLEISEDIAADMASAFSFELKDISHMTPSAIDQSLFDKIYGEGEVTSEEEFRNRISLDIAKYYERESDKRLFEDITKQLVSEINPELPENFLKKWLASVSKTPKTEEEIDNEFNQSKEALKWQLIETKIIKNHDLKVESDELMAFTKQMIASQYAQYGMFEMPEEEINKQAANYLGKREEAQKIYEQLLGGKLINLFKESYKLEKKELSFQDFVNQIYKQN